MSGKNNIGLIEVVYQEVELLKARPKVNKAYMGAYMLLLVLAPVIEFISPIVIITAGIITVMLMVFDYRKVQKKIQNAERVITSEIGAEYKVIRGTLNSSIRCKTLEIVPESKGDSLLVKSKASDVIVNKRVKSGDLVDVINIYGDFGDKLIVIKKANKWVDEYEQ